MPLPLIHDDHLNSKTCSVDSCNQRHWAKGYCIGHYRQWKRHGDALHIPRTTASPLSTLAERLESLSDRSGGPDACWPFTGGTRAYNGYGIFAWRGRSEKAHRWAWIEANGREIPEGLIVRHSCDNPPCINPAHLSIGTVQDNTDDAVSRGRFKRLVPHSARPEIQRRYDAGETRESIARSFGVNNSSIRHALSQHAKAVGNG